MSWQVPSAYLLNGEMLTDIVDILQLQGSVDAFVIFAVSVGISRATMNQRGSCGPPSTANEEEKGSQSLFTICEQSGRWGSTQQAVTSGGLNPHGAHHS